MHKILIFLALVLVSCGVKVPTTAVLSPEEEKLCRLINSYRKEKGLSGLKVSRSLTIVAQTHVRDLAKNYKRMKFFHPKINLHSWSGQGKWSRVLYTPNHNSAEGMWEKPSEITGYKGSGYEISYYSQAGADAEGALKAWKKSSGHNSVIVNLKDWAGSKWDCIGVGVYGDYACVWFGEKKDSEYIASSK